MYRNECSSRHSRREAGEGLSGSSSLEPFERGGDLSISRAVHMERSGVCESGAFDRSTPD